MTARKRVFSHLLTHEEYPRWHRRKREDVWSLSKLGVLGEGRLEKNDHEWSFNIFGSVEERNDDNVERPRSLKRSLKKNRKKRRLVAVSKRNKKLRRGVRYAKKWCMISKNSTSKKSSNSWIGENPKPMPRMLLSMNYYLCGEEGYEGLT